MKRWSSVIGLLVLAGGVGGLGSAYAQGEKQDDRIVVKTADDLPRHTYDVSGKAMDLLRDDARFNALLSQFVSNLTSDLAKYRIEDPTTLRGYYDVLSAAATLTGDLEKALDYTMKARDLETKEQEKALRGATLRARIAGKKASGTLDPKNATFAKVFKEELRKEIDAVSYDLVKDRLIQFRAQASMITPQVMEAGIAQLDPLIKANEGKVPGEVVGGLVQGKSTLSTGLPLLPLIAEVYGQVIDANAGAASEADKWTPRLVALEPTAKATPVAIAIWDSGVDVSLYPNQLWTNPKEKANGKDDDNNGFVDDLHGIAFTLDRDPTTGPLASLEGLVGDKAERMKFIAAGQDMQAGVITEDVKKFQEYYKSLDEATLKTFSEDMGLLGSYVHGTHVAGVAVAGNPFARIVHITENWPYKQIPDRAPTVEDGKAWARAFQQSVDYVKGANVRVVNMSWRVGRSAFEGMLEAKGVGATTEERAELSRQIFKHLREGLEKAIASAPDILFIAGSGNEDNDVDFAEYVPAGIRLPNLITVGAIDAQDRFTDFTSTGKNVELYANGYRIESYVPGGQKIKFSGTSMAAPQVSNLAAKILALNPNLKPADVIALIRANTDPVPNEPGRFIINPKKTLDAMKK
ncbi:MAG: S8 family serine peptidase [Planctomycetota bacterium]|nr:S8 family serine peptidase [Planctomycetota bacterium]